MRRKELHKIEKKLKHHMFESLRVVCPAQRRLLENENDGVPDGIFNVHWLASLDTDLITGSCQPELDANNTCTVYHGEIVMLTSDGVNEILAEGRIMQYLITYVENGEFERVEGILAMRMLEDFNSASDFTMLQKEQEESYLSMGTLIGMTAAVAALAAILLGIVYINKMF